jgi:hypothetical protein
MQAARPFQLTRGPVCLAPGRLPPAGPSPIMSRTCISLQVWELQTTLSSLTSMLCSTTTPLPLVHSTTQQHTTWHTAQHTAQRTRQGMLR